jgi:hypothetical protein
MAASQATLRPVHQGGWSDGGPTLRPKRLIAPADTREPNPTASNAAKQAAGFEVPPVACRVRPTASGPRKPDANPNRSNSAKAALRVSGREDVY